MAISETKMQMVIANYFKDECDVNTSIKQAFEKGFRIGVKKGASTDRPKGEWMSEGRVYPPTNAYHSAYCSHCGEWSEYLTDYCGNCGASMREREGE